jgi:hypothetical protein
MPAMNVFECVPGVPMRMVPASPEKAWLPISMLLSSVLRWSPAMTPIAMLFEPVEHAIEPIVETIRRRL